MIESPHEIRTWDSFPNENGIPPLVDYSISTKNGDVIKIRPMNLANHTPKAPWVQNAAVYYSIPYVIDEADYSKESTSNGKQAVLNRQTGKTIIYYKKGMLNEIKLPDFIGQTVSGDITEVAVHYNEKTGENYTVHYDIKIDTSND